MNIAIIGLGRVGSEFLKKMITMKDKGVTIVAAAEKNDTEGKKAALAAGIKVMSAGEIIHLKEKVDIIFDLAGDTKLRQELRDHLMDTGNQHTVLVPDVVAHLIWGLIGDSPLPGVHSHSGY